MPLTPLQALLTHTSARDLRHSQGSLTHALVRSLFLLGPGAYKVLFCPPRDCYFPRLWKFCNQIPLAFKVKFPGVSPSLSWIPSLGNLLWALEPFQQCENFFGIIVLQFVGHLLNSGANDHLLQKDLCHIQHIPGLLQPESLSLHQTLLTSASTEDTQRQVWLRLLSDLVSVSMQSTSRKMLSWMNHKLESRLPGKASTTQIGRWCHSNGRNQRGTKEPLDKGERRD